MTSEWNHFALGEITELVIDYRGKTPKKLGGDWCKHCLLYTSDAADE